MATNLPSAPTETGLAEIEAAEPAPTPLPARRPLSVAFIPLALVAFTVLTFVIAAWTFLAASGG